MIISIKDLDSYKGEIGEKTKKLKKLKDGNFNVPDFLAIPASFFSDNVKDNGSIEREKIESLVPLIVDQLNCREYTVRSSALVEDGREESLAGQFETVVRVSNDDLAGAIDRVAVHAYKYLNGEMSKFSIIIQEFIEADNSGVTFTRSPIGGREMIIESVEGGGEKLVGGESVQNRVRFFWNSEVDNDSHCLSLGDIEIFKKIEKHFDFPQDIEWCLKGGSLFILQSRPITSITDSGYEEAKYLDEFLKNKTDYYYKKTEICEIAPRPKPITFSLLKQIYKKDGPIDLVYRKYQIDYRTEEFLKIIGNELFVDKERELHSFFPAKSFFQSEKLIPEFAQLKGFWTSFKNAKNFAKIKTDDYLSVVASLKSRVATDVANVASTEEWLDVYFDDYKVVFEANLLARVAIGMLINTSQQNNISLGLLLGVGVDLLQGLDKELSFEFPEKKMIGNSFDLADATAFQGDISLNKTSSDEVKKHLEKLSADQMKMTLEAVRRAVAFNTIREYGRWLVIMRINQLRKILFSVALEENLSHKEDIYYTDWGEIKSSVIDKGKIEKRKKEYKKYENFDLPVSITNNMSDSSLGAQIGVSSGIGEGRIVTVDNISSNQKNILYTKILSADLVKHFDKIEGIVSENGGMLSHLAIIAREKNIPVVVNFNKTINRIEVGDRIWMNGESGEVINVS